MQEEEQELQATDSLPLPPTTFSLRLKYYIPVFGWLPEYSFPLYFKHDLLAGLTVAFLIIPQGLSFASALVKIQPVYGLLTAFPSLLVYSLMGTSRQLSVGPEALVSILVGSVISKSEVGMDEKVEIANLLALLVGGFTFLLGFFRLGFLDSVLSRALLRGFITAVAVVVIIDMGESMLGMKIPVSSTPPDADLASDVKSPFAQLIHIIENIEFSHFLTALISVSSITFLLLAKYAKIYLSEKPDNSLRNTIQLIPEILVVVIGTTFLSYLFRWDLDGVSVLEDVHGGFITPTFPKFSLSRVNGLFLSAVLISVIGYVESIVVAKTFAGKYNYSVYPNRELIALGTGNIVSSFFGGYPAFGSLGRSAVNNNSGAKTQMSGLVTSIVVFLTIMWLLPFFYYLPKAVCSSIIVVAALSLIEVHDIHFLFRLRAWNDLGLLCLTFFSTLLFSIETGTLLSVGVSLLLVVKHTTKTRIQALGQFQTWDPSTGTNKTKFKPTKTSTQSSSSPTAATIDDSLIIPEETASKLERILIIKIEEGLFFGNCGGLKDRLKRIEIFGDLGVHPSEEATLRYKKGKGRVESPGYESDEVSTRLLDGDETKCIIFDVSAMSSVDASASQTLLELVQQYLSRDIGIYFIKLQTGCFENFKRSGLQDLVGASHFQNKIQDAIEMFNNEHDIQKDDGNV